MGATAASEQHAEPQPHEPSELQPAPQGVGAVVGSAVVVVLATLVAYLCASFGFLYLTPLWAAPVLVGALVAVACRRRWYVAALGTAAGLALGFWALHPWFAADASADSGAFLSQLLVFALLGGVTAAATSASLSWGRPGTRREWLVSALVVLAVLGGVWATTIAVDTTSHGGSPSLAQYLSAPPELGADQTDSDLFLHLFYDVHAGLPYYDTYSQLFRANPQMGFNYPVGVMGYRLPTLYYAWLALPADGSTLIWAFLPFATLAVVSAFLIGARLSRPGVATWGALLVGVFYVFIATTKNITFSDGWAMAVLLAGVGAFILAEQRGSKALSWTAVALFLVAALLRELIAYQLVFGALSVLALPRDGRWRELRPWLIALAVFAAVYALHAWGVAGRVAPDLGLRGWLLGGPLHVLAMVEFGYPYFGLGAWLMPVLVVGGAVGALSLWAKWSRLALFATASIAAPLVALFVFGNSGHSNLTWPIITDYWGMLLVPLALALVPVAAARVLDAAPRPRRIHELAGETEADDDDDFD